MEKTVEREEDAQTTGGGVSVDGEDEVVDYLQDVRASEAAVDRWDADTAGTVTEARLVTDPEDDLLDRAGLLDPRETERADEARAIRDDLGDAVGAGEDWTAAEKVIAIEVELPNGESFEEVYRAPVWDADSSLHDVLDAAGVVPGSGDSLVGEAVPVDRTSNGWRISPPEDEEQETDESDAISLPFDIEVPIERVLTASDVVVLVGLVLMIGELVVPGNQILVWSIGGMIWSLGMLVRTWIER